MNDMKIFENPEFGRVRTISVDGEPWFVGKDVAEALGYERADNAIRNHVEEDDKLMHQISASGQNRGMYIINESGLYSLIMSSKLPNAKKFKRWVTSEVLPEIRKTGRYSIQADTPSYQITDPIERAKKWIEEEQERQKLLSENSEMKPKAEFFDDVMDSKTAIDMASVAKVLNMGIGRNKLFQFMRDKKVLQANNRPYQTYIDRGYFRCVESSYTKANGDTCVNIKTVVFQKGVDFIRKLLQEQQHN